jgi:uncharacterized repeat protein (TIGR03803 family)
MSLIRPLGLHLSRRAIAVVTAVLLSPLAFAGLTGTFTLQHTFDDMDGAFPFGSLVQGSDGNFYGTSIGEGYNVGTAFKLTPNGVFTVLHTLAVPTAVFRKQPWSSVPTAISTAPQSTVAQPTTALYLS